MAFAELAGQAASKMMRCQFRHRTPMMAIYHRLILKQVLRQCQDEGVPRRVLAAFAQATELHFTQRRKNEYPYNIHLLGASSLIARYTADTPGVWDRVIATLFHDGPEDQGGIATFNRIAKRFGPSVAYLVERSTEYMDNPEDLTQQKPGWLAMKEMKIRKVADADTNREAAWIIAADCIDNIHTGIMASLPEQGEDLWRRFSRGRQGMCWYYRQMSLALSHKDPQHPLILKMKGSVDSLLRLAGLDEQQLDAWFQSISSK